MHSLYDDRRNNRLPKSRPFLLQIFDLHVPFQILYFSLSDTDAFRACARAVDFTPPVLAFPLEYRWHEGPVSVGPPATGVSDSQ